MAESVRSLAMRAKQDAALVVDRHVNPSQKAASLALYRVLAPCLELCERCERDPSERAELERLFAAQPHNNPKGRWLEKSSDIYVLVCRFVFTETDRTNAMRYASALREAGKMQIRSDEIAEWLKTNGGVNALYFRRPLDARSVKTKCLRLCEQISFSRDHDLKLTLRWTPENTFRVMEVGHD